MASSKSKRFVQLGTPLFDLSTFEVEPLALELAKPVVNVVVFSAPAAKTGILIEDLARTSMSSYVIDSEDADRVYLRSGYEISAWAVVAEVAQPYGIRLPDGRLCEYLPGTARRLFGDSERLRNARRVMTGSRRGSESLREAV